MPTCFVISAAYIRLLDFAKSARMFCPDTRRACFLSSLRSNEWSLQMMRTFASPMTNPSVQLRGLQQFARSQYWQYLPFTLASAKKLLAHTLGFSIAAKRDIVADNA